jgi:hypothetical protein
MQVRYDWPDGVLDTIDWESHRQALQSQSTRRTHFVKLCHELLPTGSLVHRYSPIYPDYCSLCKTPNEDFCHVLRCPHQTRAFWRKTFIDSLQRKCDTLSTSPILSEILHAGLKSWLCQEPFDATEYTGEYKELIQIQSTIGWSHFFQGRIALKWSEIQQQHYSGLPPVKGRDGSSWSRNIILYIFTQWVDLWKARNEIVHGNNASTRAEADKSQAIRELEVLYSVRKEILHRDQHIFTIPIEEHKEKPTHIIRQWLNTYSSLISQSLKEAKIRSLHHVRTMDHYFGAG